MNEDSQPYEMTVGMSVLESLGINLYSNAAAVLSELVANAWDADANNVWIDWQEDGQRVVVADDGSGMTPKDINERFLNTGYQKRVEEGAKSPRFDRSFMGRKGIGKLAVFSIADVVTIYSLTEKTRAGLTIFVENLRKDITSNRPHHPRPVDEIPAPYDHVGTTLVLEELKSRRAALTAAALRKRIARRFDVLDNRSPEQGGFAIWINGERVSWKDRQELKRLEFIWEFGCKKLDDSMLPKDIQRYVFSDDAVDATRDWRVSGWIGTAKRPNDLTDDAEAGSLKNIIILARKRPIQEGIVEKLNFSGLFSNYVTGQIEADFLDLDGEYEDIATSDRQRLIEDDERVVKLQSFLRDAFVKASSQWKEARPKRQAKAEMDKYPKIKEWVEARPGWQQSAARKMIETIAGLELEGDKEKSDRAALFRSGILAFERLGLRKTTESLESLSTLSATDILPLLENQESYESALWVDILRSRLESIAKFQDLTDADEKEKVLQKHLFHNLWLLDPSWERATGSETMEENLRKFDPNLFPKRPDGSAIEGRVDIRYATTGGRHVIVELKKYSVKLQVEKLVEQGNKYVTALSEVLRKQGQDHKNIELVFVLGDMPGTSQRGPFMTAAEYVAHEFRPINARQVYYDQLIGNAKQQYAEYLDASRTAQRLDELLGTLDKEADK